MPANLKENQVDKPAMDAAIAAAVARVEARNKTQAEQAVSEAIRRTTEQLNARDDALRFVRPWVGDFTIAQDTAEGVLRDTLDMMGFPTQDIPKNVPPSALKAMLKPVPKPGEAPARPRMAADKAITSGLIERFPALKNARVVG